MSESPRKLADLVRDQLADDWFELNEDDDLAARRWAERFVPPGAIVLTAEQVAKLDLRLRADFPAGWNWNEREQALDAEVRGYLEGRP